MNERTVIVIGSFVSPYVRKVLACLELKGLRYRVDPITPFLGNDQFERLSPLRRIPVLVDGDTVVNDSSIICAYLDETCEGHSLYPAVPADRARARWIEEYADSRLGDLAIWGLFYQRVVRPLVWGEPADEERIAETVEHGLPSALDQIETMVPRSGWLFGEIGAADIAVASFFRNAAYAGFRVDPAKWPVSAAFIDRVWSHQVLEKLLGWEDIQRSASISGRRQALLDAGAPLTENSLSDRVPRRGVMPL